MKKQSKISAEQIEAALSDFCQELDKNMVPIDEVPAGWFTAVELANRLGKSLCTTRERLRKMSDNGLVERKYFTIQLERRAQRVPHYWLLKK